MSPAYTADEVVQSRLDELLGEVAIAFGGDALVWWGPIIDGVDAAVRRVVEARRKSDQSKILTILLTTNGGLVEVVHRVVDTVRHHYEVVNFVIPDSAYSAGTVLAMSGDAIFMDYYSRLGPIDPQLPKGERLVPALGYVERYTDLIKKSDKAPLNDAEFAVLVGGFDQAELYQYEQARELSISLLQDWLVQYKFKDWTTTRTRGIPVTLAQKKKRAKQIASSLSNTRRWHSHGLGISAETLRDELNLVIDDLDADPKQSEAVQSYHGLLQNYMIQAGQFGVVHMRGLYHAYHVHG